MIHLLLGVTKFNKIHQDVLPSGGTGGHGLVNGWETDQYWGGNEICVKYPSGAFCMMLGWMGVLTNHRLIEEFFSLIHSYKYSGTGLDKVLCVSFFHRGKDTT